MTYYYIWFLVFAVIAYMIVVDPNVSRYILLLIEVLKVNISRIKWMIILHPRNPITNYMMNRRANKIAKEIQESLTRDTESDKID